MLAIIGMFFQDSLIGSAWCDRALYTASRVRAIENELGVQALVGFGAPGCFMADGNSENFARRRQTGLKHGCVSMLAALRYITLVMGGMLPGCLSRSAGLKFAVFPSGLTAVSKVAAGGCGQILAYGGFCVLSQDQSAGT